MKLLLRLFSFCAITTLLQAAPLELQPGEHIAIIGNALADRLQNDGWLETLLYERFPKHDLVVRNLAVAGDEVVKRHRSENFGTPDEWLTKTHADVILAFFGFNESFGGYEGITTFKAQLDQFLKQTAAQNYSGHGSPRVVLLSPIAQEKMADPSLPDPQKNNTNLKNYTDAMAEVAQANGVPFVDLYTPSQAAYAEATAPLTIDGVHLSSEGDRLLAPVIYRALFGEEPPAFNPASEKLRAVILDRNSMWRSRYRTVDGANVFGGRSALAYLPGEGGFVADREAPAPRVSNYKIMQEEMAVRDVMTANRDRRVWAAAQGREEAVDDRNVPAVDPVPTNKPGDLPDGSHTFLSGEAAIAHMKTPAGLKVNLFASEEQFPELIKPVQMAWDTKGRLWVASWRTYPERAPMDAIGDSILILEDTDGDGRADRCTHFLDNLNCPTGFQFYKDGLLLMQAPDLWFVRDANGDGKADQMERILMGMDSADSHHTTNAMAVDPGGAVYLSDGAFHRTQVETAEGPVRNDDAAIYRFEPRTRKFETYIPYAFANPHGKVFDYWGTDLITDATGNATYFAPAFSGKLDYPGKHPKMEQFWQRPSRPCAGTNLLSSRHFPEEFQGNFLDCNVISLQAIFRVKVSEEGSGLKGESLEHLVISDDPTFRPAAVNVGPEGAVYFADWSNAIIGHMQHHLRDPNRDHLHGRIYRITAEGRPLLPRVQIAGQPIEKLLELLKTPEDGVRTLVKIELDTRDSGQVITATDQWAAALDLADPSYAHHLLEALWVHQWHDVVNLALLKKVLALPDPRARAAAARVLCAWRDRVPEALSLYRQLAADPSPRVRLEAVRAASFFAGEQAKPAVEVVFGALRHELDYYLEYCALETLRQIQPAQQLIMPSDTQSAAWLLERMDNAQLARAPGMEPVLLARLERKGVDLGTRDAAAGELAELHHTTKAAEVLAALERLEAKPAQGSLLASDLGKILTLSARTELAAARPQLENLAASAKAPLVRRAAWAAIVTADAQPAQTWAAAPAEAHEALADSISFLADPALRARFQPLLAAAARDPQTPEGLRKAALRALPLMGAENAKANFALLAVSMRTEKDRPTAARALLQLPHESWAAEEAAPLTRAILEWADTVPHGQRTEQEFVETIQAGMELASLLSPEEAAKVRKELRGVSVSVFVIKTVQEQMRYDTAQLIVPLGKPFQIIFENLDAMPHNLVIVKPGTREQVGTEASTMPPDLLDDKGRAYYPRRNLNVVTGTKLLEPSERETIKVKSPEVPGEYEFVCTFPGHWPVMWGKILVTSDPEAALRSLASAEPAAPGSTAHQHH